MNRIQKIGCLFAVAVVLTPAALVVIEFEMFRQNYGEAEPKVPAVYEIMYALRERQRAGEPNPKSLDELLSLIPEKHREQLRGHEMRWHPEAEMIFVMKVNAQFGFTLSNELEFGWLWKDEQVRLHFPKPNK